MNFFFVLVPYHQKSSLHLLPHFFLQHPLNTVRRILHIRLNYLQNLKACPKVDKLMWVTSPSKKNLFQPDSVKYRCIGMNIFLFTPNRKTWFSKFLSAKLGKLPTSMTRLSIKSVTILHRAGVSKSDSYVTKKATSSESFIRLTFYVRAAHRKF